MRVGRTRSIAALAVAPLAATLMMTGVARGQVPLFVRLDNAQNPPGLTWYTIDTPHYRVLYPDSMAAEAQRTASLLESVWRPLMTGFSRPPERIPVILNNQSAISNGFVAWAPRRSEWYVLPPTNVDEMGSIDWFSLLAVHEGRHIVQERAVRDGLVGALSKVFGQATTAFVGGSLYFPAWFWEGDAVGTETALSHAGRGRQPWFLSRIRAMRLNDQPYDYYQAWNGSYRTYYPDWYQLGYVLTTYVKRKYGADAWRRIVSSATRWPIPPMAISHGIRKVTGRSLTQIHHDAIAELDSLWKAQAEGLVETPATQLSPPNADYHSWRLPQYAADGSVIAEYADLDGVTSLKRIRGGRVETLIHGFATRGEHFSVAADRVVWSEFEVDPRFVQRSYLSLKRLDLATGKIRSLTSGGRYFGAALSPDGRRVAAVKFSESARAHLVILDADSGRELQSVANPAGSFMVTPSWGSDGASVLAVVIDRSHGRGNALLRIHLADARVDTLVPWRTDVISNPVEHGKWVFYGSPSSGIDNIEAVDPRSGERFQVTSRRYSARYPQISADGKRMLFQDYGPDGNDIAEAPLDASSWTPLEGVVSRKVEYFLPLLAEQKGVNAIANVPDHVWKVRPLSATTSGFAVHSLSVASTGDAVNNGVALSARNTLNTLAASAGVLFNSAERTKAVEVGASYGRWYPILDAALRYGQRASRTQDTAGVESRFHWNEASLQLGARVPLTRLVGLSTQQLTLGTTVGWTRVSNRPIDVRGSNNNGDFLPVSYAAEFAQTLPSGYRDIGPKGVDAIVSYRHTPFTSDYRGQLLSFRGSVFLPGLFRHDALVLDGVREEQQPGNYVFSSEYATSRGYDKFTHARFTRVGATYAFPLLYPDLAIGPWAYFKRVQGDVFGDWGEGERRDGTHRFFYRSVGADLSTDLNPVQLRQSVRLGVRWSYRVDEIPAWRTQIRLSLPY